jgi:hypothetical protein
MNKKSIPTLPGRLGNPGLLLKDDPRVHPKVLAVLALFGMDKKVAPSPVSLDAPLETRLEFCNATEPNFEKLFQALYADVPQILSYDANNLR